MDYGKKIEFEGITYYQPAEGEQGLCYKNELSFYKGGETCYIPSMAFKNATPTDINGETYYREGQLSCYTRELLVRQTESTPFTSQQLFGELEGALPSQIMLMASDNGQISIL